MSFYRDQLENWLKTIDVKAGRVLDIGGGANPVKGRTRSWDVREYYILDNMAEDFNIDFGIANDYFNDDINDHLDFTERQYAPLGGFNLDVIFCLEVFEYVWNPWQAIRNISNNLIISGGIAYISFPAIYPVHNPKEIDYLRYTKKGIEKLLRKAELFPWTITPRVATKGRQALADFYRLEGMHPVKGDDVIYDIGYLVEARK